MRRNINTETIEGRVFECDVALKTVTNQASPNFGTPYLNGTVSVATDEAGLNVLTVNYTYVTEMTSKQKPNATFANLKRIMEGKTWAKDGKDAAMKVRLNPSAALNDFYPQGGDQLVSQQRNEGGFVSIVNDLAPEGMSRQKFTFDTIINGVRIVEPTDPTAEEYARIDCAIFNFKNDLLPFTLVARDKSAIDYFVSLDPSPSNPVYTQVWGEIVCTTVKIEKEVQSAFGGPAVDVTERTQREWVIKGAKPEPYVFDSEDTITVKELEKAIADRNVHLETVKTRAKEYYANKAAAPSAIPAAAPATPTVNTQIPAGGFNF